MQKKCIYIVFVAVFILEASLVTRCQPIPSNSGQAQLERIRSLLNGNDSIFLNSLFGNGSPFGAGVKKTKDYGVPFFAGNLVRPIKNDRHGGSRLPRNKINKSNGNEPAEDGWAFLAKALRDGRLFDTEGEKNINTNDNNDVQYSNGPLVRSNKSDNRDGSQLVKHQTNKSNANEPAESLSLILNNLLLGNNEPLIADVEQNINVNKNNEVQNVGKPQGRSNDNDKQDDSQKLAKQPTNKSNLNELNDSDLELLADMIINGKLIGSDVEDNVNVNDNNGDHNFGKPQGRSYENDKQDGSQLAKQQATESKSKKQADSLLLFLNSLLRNNKPFSADVEKNINVNKNNEVENFGKPQGRSYENDKQDGSKLAKRQTKKTNANELSENDLGLLADMLVNDNNGDQNFGKPPNRYNENDKQDGSSLVEQQKTKSDANEPAESPRVLENGYSFRSDDSETIDVNINNGFKNSGKPQDGSRIAKQQATELNANKQADNLLLLLNSFFGHNKPLSAKADKNINLNYNTGVQNFGKSLERSNDNDKQDDSQKLAKQQTNKSNASDLSDSDLDLLADMFVNGKLFGSDVEDNVNVNGNGQNFGEPQDRPNENDKHDSLQLASHPVNTPNANESAERTKRIRSKLFGNDYSFSSDDSQKIDVNDNNDGDQNFGGKPQDRSNGNDKHDGMQLAQRKIIKPRAIEGVNSDLDFLANIFGNGKRFDADGKKNVNNNYGVQQFSRLLDHLNKNGLLNGLGLPIQID